MQEWLPIRKEEGLKIVPAKNIPRIPDIPRPGTPGDGEMGNEGNGGKDIPVNEGASLNFKKAKAGWSGRL